MRVGLVKSEPDAHWLRPGSPYIKNFQLFIKYPRLMELAIQYGVISLWSENQHVHSTKLGKSG